MSQKEKFEAILISVDGLSRIESVLQKLPISNDKPYKLTLEPHVEKRSITANALSHIWYNDVAKERGTTPDYEKCFCKLVFGVPIMMAEDNLFRAMYSRGISNNFTYEEQLKLMRRIPVTSLMNTEQMCRYLSAIQSTMAEECQIMLKTMACKEYENYREANG